MIRLDRSFAFQHHSHSTPLHCTIAMSLRSASMPRILFALLVVTCVLSVSVCGSRVSPGALQAGLRHAIGQPHSGTHTHGDSSFVEDAAAAKAEATLDMSMDPSGHSPFRVRHVELIGAGELLDEDHSLLEHSPPVQAQDEVNIPLTRAVARPHTVEQVLLEVRARHQRHARSMPSVEDRDLVELESQLEHHASEHLDGDEIAALEVRSTDVPLYQEVLQEKHLATYYGTLRIGSTVFRVLFDTGSCELWIPSEECKTARCERHKRYPIATSKPKYFGTTRMNIEYISGKVAGPMIVSDIGVGGLTVPNQILGLAQVLDIELLDDVVWDGIVGLSYPSKSLVTRGVTPLFDNIIKQKILSNPKKGLANQFAYYIDDTQGVMTFGGVNCAFVVRNSQPGQTPAQEAKAIDECKNSFQFVPVTRKTYWTITLDDVSLSYPKGVAPPVGQKLRGNCGKFGCRAIVDTGTYLVYTSKFFHAPDAWAKFAHCQDTHNLPNITFHLRTGTKGKSISLTLEPREYVLKFDNSVSKEDCVVGISPDKDAIFTLGQVFLRSYYALFDRQENRIGFTKIHRTGHAAVNSKPSKPPPVI